MLRASKKLSAKNNNFNAKMKVVALVSGGKDSSFNMMQCIAAGHTIVALANLYPVTKNEIDSYMYQSVGHEAIELIATAMDLPLYRRETLGKSSQRGRNYEPTENDEVEDLYELLKEVSDNIEIEAVSVGAILSDYQRVRVENVCTRLGLVPLAYLWQRNQEELLDEMIKCEIDAVVIKVASLGLEPSKHLGRSLSLLQPHLHSMHEKYGLNVCGEGGEYETLTLDCPLFKSRITIDDSEMIIHSDDAIAPVGYLQLNKLSLETKLPALDLSERLAGLPLKNCDGYVSDYDEENKDFSETETGNKLDLTASTNDNQIIECEKLMKATSLAKQSTTFAKSNDGWLWIGGLQGDSSDPKVAMEQAMYKLKSILSENAQSVKDVCSISMFISDMSQYADLNNWYCDTFNHANPPTRACVQVPLNKKCPVTIEALSWSPPINVSGGDNIFTEKHTMHVQSRSHWAPSSIGPYSQGVVIGDMIHLAGQIGLVPGSLEMVKGGIKSQCQLALRHVGRLLKAVDSNVNLRDVVQGICYLTDISHVEHARKTWENKTNNAIVDYVVVTGLPRGALVEWHVWAHKHNNQFEYEETGKCIDNWSISIYKRWNYENNIAAIVSHVDSASDDSNFDENIFVESVKYTVQKLQQGHENDCKSLYNIKIFYPLNKNVEAEKYIERLEDLQKTVSLVYTLVPVTFLKSEHTFLSVCGVRNQ